MIQFQIMIYQETNGESDVSSVQLNRENTSEQLSGQNLS